METCGAYSVDSFHLSFNSEMSNFKDLQDSSDLFGLSDLEDTQDLSDFFLLYLNICQNPSHVGLFLTLLDTWNLSLQLPTSAD